MERNPATLTSKKIVGKEEIVKNIFLTGGTGFIGRYIAYELLKQGHTVIFLSRASKNQKNDDRILNALKFVDPAILENQNKIKIVEGNITSPLLGLSVDSLPRIDEVWHIAASVSFSETNRAETFRVNIDGTNHLLTLLDMIKPTKFHYISTAYVCGNKTGVFFEDELSCGQTFHNPYEESKFIAEHAVRRWSKANPDIKTLIFRPSIVVGDSKTGKTCSYSGLYASARAYHVIKKRVNRNGSLQRNAHRDIILPIEVPGAVNAPLNIVSIDYVVDMMLKLSHRAFEGVYHVTAQSPSTYGFWMEIGMKYFGLSGITIKNGKSRGPQPKYLLDIERQIRKGIGDYLPYFTYQPRFDQSNIKKSLGSDYREHIPADARFIQTLLSVAVRNNFKEQ